MSVELHHHIHEHTKDQKKHDLIHSRKWVRNIDKVVLIIGIISPMTNIPQIYQIFVTKTAAGISVTTWLLYILTTSFWLLYGIAHKEKAIIINNILWIGVEIIIVIGALLY